MACGCNKNNKKEIINRGKKAASRQPMPLITIKKKNISKSKKDK